MLRSILAATLAAAALMGSGAAQAGTHWSIGINLPLPAVIVADSPRYVVQEPAPVYYAAPPVVYAPPPPRYIERDVYYAPPPQVIYEPAYRERRWDRREDHWHREHERHERYEHRWDSDRDDGPRRWR